MKKCRKSLSLLLTVSVLAACLSLAIPAYAADSDFTIENGVLKSYYGSGGAVVIPDGVVKIGSSAFNNYCGKTITNVIIPDSVTTIGEHAFLSCSNLQSVVIGQGVTVIPNGAFAMCASLTDVTIPDSVTSIGYGAFGNCTSLRSIVIPDSVVFLDNCAFIQCSNLENVVLPDTTVYRSRTFAHCDKLPESMTGGANGFQAEITGGFTITNHELEFYSGSDSHVTIPDEVTAICNDAFRNCTGLISVDCNHALFVDSRAFDGCVNLESVDCGNAVFVDDTAFDGCVNLETLTNYPDKTLYENVAANKRITGAWTAAATSKAVKPQSEKIRTVSEEICAGLSSDYEKLKAIYSWVAENITYDYDYFYGKKSKLTYLPEDVLDSRLTVCEGYSRLTQALIQAQGIPALCVSGSADGIRGWEDHSWNLAYADGRWIYLDTTWGSPSVGNSETINYDWFDPAALYFSFTHKGSYSYTDPIHHNGDNTPKTVGNFADVKIDVYYADAVLWAVENNITNGTSNTAFSPDQICTRAQIITFLWRAAGSPEPQGTSAFSDVDVEAYYAKATVWAAENGMADGTNFEPNAPCTREMAVEFMWKYAGSPSASASDFSDVSSPAVDWAVEESITSGTGDGKFSPDNSCTRAQIVTFLYRAEN